MLIRGTGLDRRRFLRLGAAAGALPWLLPFLDAFRPRRARAQGMAGPKRLLVFHTPQGSVLRQFVPRGAERDFELPHITAPLAAVRDRVTIITGLDNVQPRFNRVGNAHLNANYTVLTGRPFLAQVDDDITAGGPSIEQVVADHIGGATPFRRLDFAVGGHQTSNGLLTPREGAFFWHGPRDPVAAFNNPLAALLRVFGDGQLSPADAWAQRARRASVLDGVLQNFASMRRDLGAEDRARLDAHAEKLRELERRIVAGVGECRRPDVAMPPSADPGLDDDLTAPVTSELVATALACDLTRVATVSFANGHAPAWPWLWGRNGGRPIVDLAVWENWHAVVHADYQPGMEHPYRWYMETFVDLLQRMAAMTDADGDNLLDTSLVVYLSEYSSGRHWNTSLPVVLAGNLGAAPGHGMSGRWVDVMDGGVDALEASNGYRASGATMNQLWTSVLRMFGGAGDFGFNDGSLPTGGLPALGG
ncbi:MAG: DUF1552 domain-containing protein [Myxococcales bacterium]|nr:DUF1552 domain-containing protein [Myxococcales bacterium]